MIVGRTDWVFHMAREFESFLVTTGDLAFTILSALQVERCGFILFTKAVVSGFHEEYTVNACTSLNRSSSDIGWIRKYLLGVFTISINSCCFK